MYLKNTLIATALAAGMLVLSACSTSSSGGPQSYASILATTTVAVSLAASPITAASTPGTDGNTSFTLSETGYTGLFSITPAQSGCVVIYTTTPLPSPTNNKTGPTNQPSAGPGSIGTSFVANGATCVTTAGYTLPTTVQFTITDTLGNSVIASATVAT
jgi:hypothetical protein